MSEDKVYDVCVVGAGLWGSAAAKYCSERGVKVCLVGPSEPKTKEERDNRFIFGAHYDEGRMCGTVASEAEWIELACRSAKKYKKIEESTGIQFFKEVGLMVLTVKRNPLFEKILDVAKTTGIHVDFLDKEALHQRHGYLSIDNIAFEAKPEIVGFYQGADAGHINPRKLLPAQQMMARSYGCEIFDDIVKQVQRDETQDAFKLTTENGRNFTAKKVLLCTGAFTQDLLPQSEKRLDIRLVTQEVLLVEFSEADRDLLRDMPSIWCHEGETDLGGDCYIMPPIQYPDGKYYLKIGHCFVGQEEITSKEQLKSWYCGQGNPETTKRLTRLMRNMFPGLKPLSMHSDTCVTVPTPTRRLYCDMVSSGLGVAVGGNGFGAKSSDEIGRMAANMILRGEWDYDMPKENFQVQWKTKDVKA